MDTRATIFVTLTAICCLACACDRLDAPQDDKQAVEVDVSVDGQNPSRVSVSENKFEANDKFRFFFNSAVPTNDTPPDSGGDADLKITDYVYGSDSKWTTSSPIFWNDYQAVERNFCAVLPFSDDYFVGTTDADHTFTVQANQSAETGYKKSDLLMARVHTTARLIPLTFYHVMAKVEVEVKAETGAANPDAFDAGAFAEITASLNNIKPKGKIAFGGLDGTESNYDPKIEVKGDGNADNVSMLRLADPAHPGTELSAQFTALIPPQTVGVGEILLTFSLAEGGVAKTYYMKAPTGGAIFEQGKSTRVTVTLKKQQVEIDEANNGIIIVGWNEEIEISPEPPIVLD